MNRIQYTSDIIIATTEKAFTSSDIIFPTDEPCVVPSLEHMASLAPTTKINSRISIEKQDATADFVQYSPAKKYILTLASARLRALRALKRARTRELIAFRLEETR